MCSSESSPAKVYIGETTKMKEQKLNKIKKIIRKPKSLKIDFMKKWNGKKSKNRFYEKVKRKKSKNIDFWRCEKKKIKKEHFLLRIWNVPSSLLIDYDRLWRI